MFKINTMVKFHVLTLNPKTSDSLKYFYSLRLFQNQSVQLLSHVRLFATPLTAACQASLSITNSQSPPNPCPLSWWCHRTISSSVVPFSSCPQSFPASRSFQMSQFFESGGQSIGFSFNISPSNEHPGLISFRMDCLDLLAVQGTLKSLLQYHSSKVSIYLQCVEIWLPGNMFTSSTLGTLNVTLFR